jgi:hypothetical protein
MSRDLPVIGNPAEPTLHSHCFVADDSAVDNFIPITWSERREWRRESRDVHTRIALAPDRRSVCMAMRLWQAQSKRLETDSSAAVRPIASPISEAISIIRIFPADRISFVG